MTLFGGWLLSMSSEGQSLPLKWFSRQLTISARTPFEPEPRVGSRHVDLLRLYNVVLNRGGYDKVSATKLEWRTIGEEFNLGISNLPALAFNMKTTFYKYLA